MGMPSFQFVKPMTLSLLLVQQSLFSHALGNNPSCQNFSETKNRLSSIMRAFQCQTAGTASDCEKFLGLGSFGLAALTAAAAAKGLKGANQRLRNPDFVLCPLNFKSAALDGTQHDSALYTFNLLKKYPAHWGGMGALLLSDSALADCTRQEAVAKTHLQMTLQGNLREIQSLIDQQKAALKSNGAVNSIPAETFEERDSLRKQIESTQEELNTRNEKLSNVEQLKTLETEVFPQHPKIKSEIEDLMGQTVRGEKAPLDAQKELSAIIGRGYNDGLTSEQANLLGNTFKSRITQLKMINQLNGKIAELQSQRETLDQKIEEQRLAINQDDNAKLKGTQQQNLSSLEKNKSDLQQISRELERSRPLNSSQLLDITEKLYDSGALSSEMIRELNIMKGSLQNNERIAIQAAAKASMSQGLMTGAERMERYHRQAGSWVRPSLNLKAMAAKSTIGVVTSMGLVSAASAADKEQQAVDFLDAIDPTSALVHSKDLGGNCSDMRPTSQLIARDPDHGCQFKLEFNEKLTRSFLEADDSTLKELFKDAGVCEFIQKNYESYYPRVKLTTLNCKQRPLAVAFDDGSRISIDDSKMEFSKDSANYVHFDRSPSNQTPFKVLKKGAPKEGLSEKDFSDDYLDAYKNYSRLLAASTEIAHCCALPQSSGATLSAEDCQRYNIREPQGNILVDEGRTNSTDDGSREQGSAGQSQEGGSTGQ